MFVGAGISMAPPSSLPSFNQIRSNLLEEIGLGKYAADSQSAARPSAASDIVASASDLAGSPVEMASAMFPEPFLFELHRAGVDVDAWLGQVLGHGEPNVVHVALARLAKIGAKVWTVNFDPLIEKAGALGSQ